MEAFFSKVIEGVCVVVSVAPAILVKLGEGAVVVGNAIKSVLCAAG